MMKFFRYSILIAVLIHVSLTFVLIAAIFPFFLCSIFIDRKRLLFTKISGWFCRYFLLTSYFWKIKIIENPKLKSKQTYIYVANHQSLLDILVAFFIKHPFKFVAKKTLFFVPIIGLYMRFSRFIPIERGNKESIIKMFDLADKEILMGNSLFFFPEGSRILKNTLKPFKKGAFTLAIKHQIPIVPVAIHCTKKSLFKKMLHDRGRETLIVKIFDPLMPTAKDDEFTLAAKARKVILNELYPNQ